jgi:hypothetical protein
MTTPRTAVTPAGHAARDKSTAIVAHPEWCDPARCTATEETATLESHRSRTATITANFGLADLTVTANLYQAYAPWLTSVLIKLDVSGLNHDYAPVSGAATLTVEQVRDLAGLLSAIAAQVAAWQDRQTAEYRAALHRAVGT